MSDVTAAGTAAAIPVPAPAPAAVIEDAATTVQDAIDAAVAQFRTQLEGKIKTAIGISPTASTASLVSRIKADATAIPGELGSGAKTLVTDAETIAGKTASAAVGVLPSWATYPLYGLGAFGAGNIVLWVLQHIPAIHFG